MALKTDYKDDILDVSQNTKRKYTMIENQDGTVSFDDETVYSQEGDSFGASDINAITEAVNSNSGMPVGTIATFDGTTLPSGFEPYQTEEQRAIAQINDNLSGFKFYPSGTAIVGLVADDSPYEDADGNYILADSATGRGLIDGVTYKSINSTEDTRGKVGEDIAVKFGGVNMNVVGSVELALADAYPTYASDAIIVNDGKYKKLKVNLTSIGGGSTFIKTLNADSTVKDTLTTNNSGTYEFDIHDAYSIYMRCYSNQASKFSKINYILE